MNLYLRQDLRVKIDDTLFSNHIGRIGSKGLEQWRYESIPQTNYDCSTLTFDELKKDL